MALAVKAVAAPAADFEGRLKTADHAALRLWLRLMTVHRLVESEIRRRLRRDFTTTLPRFDLMAQLERAPGGIRITDLSKRLMVTSGNVTQLADEMERDGLVERLPDPRNRRASLVQLTRRGAAGFAAIARAHEAWVIELLAGLPARDKQTLLALLAKEKNFLAREVLAAD